MLLIVEINIELHPIYISLYGTFGITFFTHSFDDMLQKRGVVHEYFRVINTRCIYRQHYAICPIRADRGHSGVFQQLPFAWLEENVYKRDT